MKIIVFCGPTISVDEASRIITADFKPPIKHGDLISCIYNDNPDVVVIIDGAFIDQLSLWHNEINEAINKGVTVYGASAIGAIRAAEMQKSGMRGVGEVFRMYSDGIIDADDEVLCDYSVINGTYNKKTISLVNLRHVLPNAVKESVIKQDQADSIILAVKSMFYKDRTISEITIRCLNQGIVNASESELLKEYISKSESDLQKNDAMECLEKIGNLLIEDLDKKEKNYQYDLFFEALYERDRGTKNGEEYHSFYKIANDYTIYSSDIETLNDAALNRKICALVADNFKVEATDEEIRSEKKLFTLRYGLTNEPDYQDWLKANDLTENEFNELLAERVKINKIQNWYRTRLGFAKNTRYILEELKLNNQYTEWKRKSIDIHDQLKDNQEEINRNLNSNELTKLTSIFLNRNSRPWKHAPFNFINKIGVSPQVFKYLLARDKTLSDIISRELSDQI